MTSKEGNEEAIARSLTQMVLYPLEALKINMQIKKNPKKIYLKAPLTRGIIASTVTTGISYGTYFNIYNKWNQLMDGNILNILAPVIASVGSSVIRVPIGNGMRNIQAGLYPTLTSAIKGIITNKGVQGLYQGYVPMLLEDMIEMELKIKAYQYLTKCFIIERPITPAEGVCIGAISGSWGAYWTTPFDVLKTHMAIQKNKSNTLDAFVTIWKDDGIRAFGRGWSIRVIQQALKTGVFFGFMEILR